MVLLSLKLKVTVCFIKWSEQEKERILTFTRFFLLQQIFSRSGRGRILSHLIWTCLSGQCKRNVVYLYY
ncbi:hypothetical protein SUGI_0520360 [Cryptomeria japonica]|nr:hypothetical protein SUGI_0520360 [Cryptomeria japonica]